jgi:hypothetical protein
VTHNEVVLLNTRLAEARKGVSPESSEDEYFQLDAIDTVLRQRGLSHQDLEDGDVDGADDGGIDAVFTFLNGALLTDESSIRQVERPSIELELFQVKNEAGFGETPIQKLIDHLPQLLALDADTAALSVEFNERILDRFALFRSAYLEHATRMPALAIRVLYATKSSTDANAKVRAKAERLVKTIKSGFPSAEITVEFIGAAELNVLARARPVTTHELRLAEQPISAELGGMVALVRLRDYYQFVRDPRGGIRESIFEENVRGYEGLTNINKGIAKSLQDVRAGSVDFWWLNNGVTILGSRVSYAQKMAAIEDPQVVNGLQTSRAIYNHFEGRLALGEDDRHVLVRIIQAADEKVAGEIIRATNSQNRVPSSSLRASEPFQRSIEEYLLTKGRYYERRRNYYKNQGVRRAAIVTVSELAQAVASISLAAPHDARGRPAGLLKEKTYPKVFGENTPLEFYWRAIQIVEAIDGYLMESHALGRQARSNIRFHLARVAVSFAVTSSRARPSSVVRIDAADLRLHLGPAYEWLSEERNKFSAASGTTDHGTLAKSPEFNAHVNSRLSKYSDKQKWPKNLGSGWALATGS